MAEALDKVTAFVVRPSAAGHDLLLFEHGSAGIQLPAGTVEAGETPEAAVLREAREETGLAGVAIARPLGVRETVLPEGQCLTRLTTAVYPRPSIEEVVWARLRHGLRVRCARRSGGFAHVTYEEWDRLDAPRSISFQITGWVPEAALTGVERRHFYLLTAGGETPERWEVSDPPHRFTLFWAAMAALPALVPPQDGWLAMLPADIRAAR